MTLDRRSLLKASLVGTVSTTGLLPLTSAAQERRFAPQKNDWRTFELTTEVAVADVEGVTKLWLPIPDLDTDYQRTLNHSWSGNASLVRIVADARSNVRMAYAEFPASADAPVLSFTSRFQTRNRVTDWTRPSRPSEDPDTLRRNTQATDLLPTDGIVRDTARRLTQGANTHVDKVRAIYDWVIANAHREPTTRGCGSGDIRAMLETGDLSGKCADLNALFVGLCRSCGIPARDIYGVRLAPSAFPYKELGANSANLKGAQHCRAEVWLADHGWVAMDPADVLKVMRQETVTWIKDSQNAIAAPVKAGLFGGWEGNWVGWNTGHDITLPDSSSRTPIGFLMYPNGENSSGRFDELSPDSFRYKLAATEIKT